MTGPNGHAQQALFCRHLDLSSPLLVFGGLCLIATVAICGTIDASTGSAELETSQTLSDEYAIGPGQIDPVAMTCEQQGKIENSDNKTCQETVH